MRKIKFIEPNSLEWKNWIGKCNSATMNVKDCIKQNAKWKKNNKLYNAHKKSFYFKKEAPFFGKCVYCEKYLRIHDAMDHFRPAARITNDNGEVIKIKRKRMLINHPGYYWLCYNFKNLLPCCAECNGPIKPKKKKVGKHDQFPIVGKRASLPGKEKNEKPLLINPLSDKPEKHFIWDNNTKKILGKTKKGQKTIEILGFYEREDLIQAWSDAYKEVLNALGRFILPDTQDGELKRDNLKKEIKEGKTDYSFVKLEALKYYQSTGPI